PPILAATHVRFRTPYVAVVVTAISVLLVTFTGTFLTAAQLSTVIRLATYAVTCAALPMLRRLDDRQAQFVAPAGNIVALVALALIGWLFSSSSASDALLVAIAASGGLLFYMATARRWRAVTAPSLSAHH